MAGFSSQFDGQSRYSRVIHMQHVQGISEIVLFRLHDSGLSKGSANEKSRPILQKKP